MLSLVRFLLLRVLVLVSLVSLLQCLVRLLARLFLTWQRWVSALFRLQGIHVLLSALTYVYLVLPALVVVRSPLVKSWSSNLLLRSRAVLVKRLVAAPLFVVWQVLSLMKCVWWLAVVPTVLGRITRPM